jgi:predicted O-linked N-acetylglucosamine transferase (SPINDLY family)
MNAPAMGFLVRRPIQAHDRSRMEVFGYAPMPLPEAEWHTVFDKTRVTSDMSDADFVRQVREDKIDVLVELTGFSPGHRFGAMAHRCAPVQVSYLNHFATSRVPNVDYILSDDICTPADSAAHETFSEKIYRLPHCLLCYDYTDDDPPPISDPPSLSRNYVTFGCFGSGGKINTPMVERWATLMHRVPNSRMLIQNAQLSPPDNRRFMADRFARHGIAVDRLDLRSGTGRAEALDAHRLVDVSLDTSPYGGGNTVAESLWQGVPVVTLTGELFCGRYGTSLLHAAGCSEFVANSPDEYIEIAARLAAAPERLRVLRHSLRDRYTAAGLNDSPRFSRCLEQAYFEMAGSVSSRTSPATGGQACRST